MSAGNGISILVPYRSDGGPRDENWSWLGRYWSCQLPGAEIVIGETDVPAFSRSDAINNAASKAHGDVFLIADADCYIPRTTVIHCVEQIRVSENTGKPCWYVPYNVLYRLAQEPSRAVIESDPRAPKTFTEPLDFSYLQYGQASAKRMYDTHKYGGGVSIVSRPAFYAAGSMDPRFKGWGHEDASFTKALDTLYGRHLIYPSGLFHLWHPVNQSEKNAGAKSNLNLYRRYIKAAHNPAKMQELVDEHDK